MKRCIKCQNKKPLYEFSKHVGAKDGLDGRCRECRKGYRADPVVKSRQALSKSRYEIRKAGRRAEDTLTSFGVAFVLNEGQCAYCGREMTYSDATMDHIIPISRGGNNTLENITAACRSCNTKKGQKPALLFLLQDVQPYYSRKLIERMALRSGKTFEESFVELATDTQRHFGR